MHLQKYYRSEAKTLEIVPQKGKMSGGQDKKKPWLSVILPRDELFFVAQERCDNVTIVGD
jgi:hypothetical protein